MSSDAQDQRVDRVAVSYSWKEEREGANAGAVGKFCDALKLAGVEVIRDIGELHPGDSLVEFMRSLGKSDFLCVFLSDGYLKSPNCMYELHTAWNRSKDDASEFRQRVKAWVMPGANIYSTKPRLGYLDHWNKECDEFAELVQKYGTKGWSSAAHEEYRRVQKFAVDVDEMLCHFAKTLSPESEDAFLTWISQLTATKAENPTEVFREIVEALESCLAGNKKVADFVGPLARPALLQQSGEWKIAPAYRSGGADVCAVLNQLAGRISAFSGSRYEWDDLERIIGGIFVLGMSAEWVDKQRGTISSSAVEYPRLGGKMNFSTGKSANFLAALAAALANGSASLERIFNNADPSCVDDLPAVFPGIAQADRIKEIKRHFIRTVHGPTEKVDINTLDGDDLTTYFDSVRQMLTSAMKYQRSPVIADGERMAKVATEIKQMPELQDLILFSPVISGNVRDIMKDTVIALGLLAQIHKIIQSRRPSV